MSKAVRAAFAAAAVALLVPVSAGAEANSVTVTETIPIEFATFSTCVGSELVFFTGEAHTVFHTTIDDTGSLHLKTQSSGHLTGVGETTGTTYQAIVVGGDTINFLGFPGPFTVTLVHVVRITGPGPLNNEMFDLTIHGTFDANGVPHGTGGHVDFRCAEDGPR